MFGTLFLLFTQLAGALYMSAYMTQYAIVEMLVIFVGLLGGITHFYGEYNKLEWNWKFGSVYYAFALLNLVLVYFFYRNYLIQGIIGVLAIVGIVRIIGKMDAEGWEEQYYQSQFKPSLETYDLSGREQIVEADPMYVNIARDDWKNRATVIKSARVEKTARSTTKSKGRGRPKGSKDKKPRKRKD